MKSLARNHWLPTLQAALANIFVSVHTNLQDLIPTFALVVCVAYNYAAKLRIKSCRFV